MTTAALKSILVAFAVLAGPAGAGAQDHLFPCPFKAGPVAKDGVTTPDPLPKGGAFVPRGIRSPFPAGGAQFFEPRPGTDWDRLFSPKPVDLLAVRGPRVMDPTRLPGERAIVLKWAKSFPELREDFEVLGPCTAAAKECITKAGTDRAIPGTYNCISHTAGITNIWVNPYQKQEAWDLYYAPLGYTSVDSPNTRFEEGQQKVALFALRTRDGKLKEYTHAAVQEADGTWTSKLGNGPLIRHRTAESVCGPDYGEIIRVYARKRLP